MSSMGRNVEIQISYQGVKDVRNIVDKQVQAMLYPLNLMQIMVLNPKYCMKNNFIKPNNRFNKFIICCGLVIYLTGYIYRVTEILVDDNMKRYGSIQFLYFASYYDFVFYSAGFILNVILHCIHTKKTVTFVLAFQEVHRFLNNDASFKLSIIRNWISVIILFGFYLVILLFMSLIYNQPCWYVVLNLIFLASLDTNLIYAMSLIKLLADKIELWNVRVLLPSRNKQGENNEMEYDRMSQAYVHILKCYENYKKIFQQPILYQTIETFCRCLINVQVMIEFRRLFLVTTPLVSLFLYFWMIKTLVLQLVLSLQVETFYEAVKLTQDSCLSVLASNCTDDQKKLCKNILRVHNASYNRMTACGLFYVDICLALRLIALLTHYTVVLLQFAFL